MVDQYYWGQWVRELDVDLPAISCTQLDAEGLGVALQELTYNTRLQDKASELCVQIRSENYVGEAIRLIW